MKRIYFTVTNDLTYDQRMDRICSSLVRCGYRVTLVGRKVKSSIPLQQKVFYQKRLKCFFNKGVLFYAEYNLRLFFFLLLKRMDGICAIDLDTILPCLLISKLKNAIRIYDAHEYFTELKEVRTRALVRRIWLAIEKLCVPCFENGYTVSNGLVNEFAERYNRKYELIRNVPWLRKISETERKQPYIFYGGAVNEARGFEYLIPAMKNINSKLIICGDGNFMQQLKELLRQYDVEDKVEIKGMMSGDVLFEFACNGTIGLHLAERDGINQYHALANKFFDYIQAGLPQITMNFPEYKSINDEFKIAVLIDDLSTEELAHTINLTINDKALLEELHQNALRAKEVYNWQNEEKKLVQYYQQIFGVKAE